MEISQLIKQKSQFKTFEKNFKEGNLNHAFLVVGADSAVRSVFCEEIANYICGKNNIADKYIYKSFAVNESNDMVKQSSLKPMMCDFKCFVVDAGQLSKIVQNKILKTLEEPPKNCYFFLSGENIDNFLPTIKSRANKIVLDKLNKNDFDVLNLSSVYEKSFGNLAVANKLRDGAFAKKFDIVLQCLSKLEKSSEIINFARQLAKTSEELQNTLEIFELVLSALVDAKTKHQKFFSEQIDNQYTVQAAAMIVEAILKAKKQCFSNCNVNAIVDELLFKILEIKYICKKSL